MSGVQAHVCVCVFVCVSLLSCDDGVAHDTEPNSFDSRFGSRHASAGDDATWELKPMQEWVWTVDCGRECGSALVNCVWQLWLMMLNLTALIVDLAAGTQVLAMTQLGN